jgi:hypothetical protein
MSSSAFAGKDRMRPEMPTTSSPKHADALYSGKFVAVTRNPDVCGVARKRTCCTSTTVQYGPGPDKGRDSDEIAAIHTAPGGN